MRAFRMILLVLCVSLAGRCVAQSEVHPKKHLLIIGEEKGYRHEAVSHAMAVVERLGRESGLWDTTIPQIRKSSPRKNWSTTPRT